MLKRRVPQILMIVFASLSLVAISCGSDSDGSSNGSDDSNEAQSDAGGDGGSVGDSGEDADDEYDPCEDEEGEYCGGNDCVDLNSDPDHCGGCDQTCMEAFGECIEGECICDDDDATYCDGFCVDTDVDKDNCSDCGIACDENQLCWGAECMSHAERMRIAFNDKREEEDVDCGADGTFGPEDELALNEALSDASYELAAHWAEDLENNAPGQEDFEREIEAAGFEGTLEDIVGVVLGATQNERPQEWFDTGEEPWTVNFCATIMDPDATHIGAGVERQDPDTTGGNWAWVVITANLE